MSNQKTDFKHIVYAVLFLLSFVGAQNLVIG